MTEGQENNQSQQFVPPAMSSNNMAADWGRTFNLNLKLPVEDKKNGAEAGAAKPAAEAGAAKPAAEAGASKPAAEAGAAKPATEAAKPGTEAGAAKPAAEAGKAGEGVEKFISDIVELEAPSANADTTVFKTFEDFQAAIKKEFNVDDAATFLNAAKKFRNDSSEKGVFESKYKNLAEAIQKAPPILYDALDAYWKGEDYKGHLAKVLNEVDYSLPIEQQNMKLLIKKISPDVNIDDANGENYLDLNDEKNPAVKALINSVKKQYQSDQSSLTEKKTRIAKDQEANASSFLNSITSSIDSFKTKYPKIDAKTIKAVEDVLNSDDVEKVLLLDEKGKYRADAAERIFYSLQGEAKYLELANAYKKLTAQYQELLGRGSAAAKNNGGLNTAIETQKPNRMAETFLGEKKSPFRQKQGV